ncbi:MAG: hypothetical protein M5U22_07135 [Thermoleophilia bacterium]|nr:hypothetical protein [Thermoleophilia bacterium]
MSGETPISPRDEVSHEVFGQGLVEEVRGDVVTVRFARAGRKTILRDYLVRQTAGGLPHRRPDALTLFDAYLMVDWSANSRPKTGKDSVWWCLHEPESGRVLLENPPTREQGLHEVRASLTRLLSQGQRVLVGFDFPYGFPGVRPSAWEWRPTVPGAFFGRKSRAWSRTTPTTRTTASRWPPSSTAPSPGDRLLSGAAPRARRVPPLTGR